MNRSVRAIYFSALLSLTGLFLSGYLAFLHLALLRGELFGGILCGEVGSFLNCHAVSASRFSRFLGLPLAFWGVFGYLLTLTLSLIADQFEAWRGRACTVLAGMAALFLLVDAALLWIMLTQIEHLCVLCLATYAVNAGLLVAAQTGSGQPFFETLRRLPRAFFEFYWRPREPVPVLFGGVAILSIGAVCAVYATADFFSRSPGSFKQRMATHVRTAPRVKVNTEGDPRRGSAQAPIEMVEFTDFFCPSCQEAARFNEIILSVHRPEVAWVLKHYPLDRSCNDAVERTVHPNACLLAAAAECAHAQGKFWEFHDRVVRHGPSYNVDDLEKDAVSTGLNLDDFRGCLARGEGMEKVKQDIAEARRIEVAGTPTFVVNGVQIRGGITPSAFGELKSALQEVPSDTAVPNGA